jgi:lysozyme family protein
VCDTIIKNQPIYEQVQRVTKIPFYVVGTLHARECDSNFSQHLHNGDPLTARTVHAPAGRPVPPPASGHFPYQWFESAIDAFKGEWFPPNGVFDAGNILAFCEHYNGWGAAERHGVNTPYLWSYTDQYTAGMYVADYQWSDTAVNKQPGCAAVFLALKARGLVTAF